MFFTYIYIVLQTSNTLVTKYKMLIFWINFVDTIVFPVKNRIYEHHHRIQHIGIILDTKFYLKKRVFIVLNKFIKKES